MDAALLEMKGICKTFPGVKALDHVGITVRRGEVHALLGENGAGKSTLIKILGGIYVADSGEVWIDGKPADISSVDNSKREGISIVHQELCLCDNMTVAQNIFLGQEKKKTLFCNDKEMNDEADRLLSTFGIQIGARDSLGGLTVAQQQMVELAKALSADARIIVMDEPTDTLTDREIHKLFEAIRTLRDKGVGIIYISHRMEEIFEIADTITVLRDGQFIGSLPVREANYHDLVTMLIGREMNDMFAALDNEVGETLLEARNINCGKQVVDCSFHLRKGEILGFYGLVGSGRTELMRTIFGVDRMQSGEIYYRGSKITVPNVQSALSYGINLVPEDRKVQGLVLIQSVGFNIVFGVLDKLYRGLRHDKKQERGTVAEYIRKLRIKTPSAEQAVQNLSGGNQQKVVLAKALATKPDVLILDEPTRGIDVGAKKEIYDIMSMLASEGVSIIMISSELPEVINMSNRIMVMYEGRIAGQLAGHEMTQENIIILATGGRKDDAS
ncbi:sugar ABC transporter ATP-binding protein [Intestinibacillus massiliensis]|nr:sugar ABC transporter ATP-binding protein [Intestinibacillus massiliensis]